MKRVSLLLLATALGLSGAEPYRKPPQPVLDLLNAPPTPTLSISPARTYAMQGQPVRYPPIAELSQPMLRLAGQRINPKTNGLHNTTFNSSLTLRKIPEGTEIKVDASAEPEAERRPLESRRPHFAFTNTTNSRLELWVGDTGGARWRRARTESRACAEADAAELGRSGGAMDARRQGLLVNLVKPNRGPAPRGTRRSRRAARAGEPGRRGARSHARRHAAESRMTRTCSNTTPPRNWPSWTSPPARRRRSARPAIVDSARFSPDGKNLLVTTIHKPFSYLHQYRDFPQRDRSLGPHRQSDAQGGQPAAPRQDPDQRRQPPARAAFNGGRASPPRWSGWRRSTAATSRIRSPSATACGAQGSLHRHAARGSSRPSSASAALQFAAASAAAPWSRIRERKTRRVRTFKSISTIPAKPAEPDLEPQHARTAITIPARPIDQSPAHRRPAYLHGWRLHLPRRRGAPAPPATTRSSTASISPPSRPSGFSSATPTITNPSVALLDDKAGRFLTRRESPTEPPNYFVRTAGGQMTAMTNFPDPQPIFRKVSKQLVTYKRPDGVPLSLHPLPAARLQAGHAPADPGVGLSARIQTMPTPPARSAAPPSASPR